MSRGQKLLLSMLGSILLHCILGVMLVSGVLVPNIRATHHDDAIAEPEEVVVMLSDILPQPLDGEREKMFVRTDPDSESDEAPVDARFESDRNTLAATENLPEPAPESIDGMPTIVGRIERPGLELRDRDFSDGEEPGAEGSIELPAPGSPAVTTTSGSQFEDQVQAADPIAGGGHPASDVALEKSNQDNGSGDAEGATESPEVAEKLQRPEQETSDMSVDEVVADTTRNPLIGNSAEVMALDGDSENQDAETEKPMSGEVVGSPAGPKETQEKTASDLPPAPTGRKKRPAGETSSDIADGGAMAANSSSASTAGNPPAFSPETRANHVSGTLSNLGDRASVDAEGTELGRYKQGVVTAIEKSWHRYRLSNRDDVTAGNLRLRFRIDSSGQVRNLKILRNEANTGMTEFTLKAILAADIPAMPADVAGLLGSEGLVMNYTILVAY